MVSTRRRAIRQQQQQQLHQQRQRQRPRRQASQKFHIITSNINNNTPIHDGIITHFNISNKYIIKLSNNVPFMKGEKYRGPRYVVTNDTAKYASESLFKDIVKEINTHLKYKCKIDADFVSSEWGSWVLAPPTNLCNSRHGGGIHRDTKSTEIGYLTVLILLGQRWEEEYGGVTFYANSQDIRPGVDNIKGNNKHYLDRQIDAGVVTEEEVRKMEYNCIVFDSRLLHFSHKHTQHMQRTVFSIQLNEVRDGLPLLVQNEVSTLSDEDGYVGRIEY